MPDGAHEPVAGQISGGLPDGTLVLSCAKPVEDGARASLIVAPGLFRFDVRPVDDTLEMSVRNLSATTCAWAPADEEPRLLSGATDEVIERLRPGAHAYRVDVAGRRADVLVSTARDGDEGCVRFVAQARIDPPPTARGGSDPISGLR